MTQLVDLLESLADRMKVDPYGNVPLIVDQPVPNSSQGPVSYANSVPEPVNQQLVFRGDRGARIWKKLKDSAGLPEGPYEELGRGTRGTAYGVEERVLKITSDTSEAIAAAMIRDRPDPRGNAQRIFSVWRLKGVSVTAHAIVQERLEQMDEEDPWIQLSDLWPDWSRSNDYAPIQVATVPSFFGDVEAGGLVDEDDPSWQQFKIWFTELAEYLDSIELLYHDFWHRNLLMRGDQHVAIDFGYSISEADKPPNIDVIAKFKELRASRALRSLVRSEQAKVIDEIAERLVVDEDAVAVSDYPEGFSLEELKSLAPPKAAKYAQQHLLKLGKGSSRVAFAVDTNKVLKVALNAKGLAQNAVESDVGRHYDCVTKVFDADYSGDTWVEVERARKARAADFKRLAGLTFKQIAAIIWYTHRRRSAQYNEFKLEAPAGYDPEHPLMSQVLDMMINYDMPAGDLMRPSHWGVVKRMDGEHLVLVDFGLTQDVYDEHYSAYRKRAEGATPSISDEAARQLQGADVEATPKKVSIDVKELVRLVQESLDDSLRRAPWKGSENAMAGHCYVACEALFHLTGGQLRPFFVKHENAPHWFLKAKDGTVVDPTHEQFGSPVPYENGVGKGFLTKLPSKRAQVVIDRVRKMLS